MLYVGMLMLLTGLLISGQSAAKRIYTYTDENGVTHYTDKKPKTEQEVESRLVKVDPKAKLNLMQVGSQKQPRYRAINQYHGPVEVGIAFTEAVNVRSDPPLPNRFVLPARAEQDVISVAPLSKRSGYSFSLKYEFVLGDPNAQHDPEVLYHPPLPPGHKAFISQAFNGAATHGTTQSRYAVDIALQEGTPVHAARDGVVMDVDSDFYGAGTSKRFLGRANQVRVLHLDGTMAVYAHLELESIMVHPGQVVIAGDLLARSGNTGFSNGPHLHFVVQKNRGMKLESIPFRFRSAKGMARLPKQGEVLRGYKAPID